MTRKEYIDSIKKQATDSPNQNVPEHDQPDFVSLDEYLMARRKCERYENNDISQFLTKEDYEQFDKNFEKALVDILYTDEDYCDDEIDKTIEMMEAVDWKWAKCLSAPKTPNHEEFLENIKYCYEHCLNSGAPKPSCSTGGITVKTDVLDHTVEITFSSIDAGAFDNDD